MNGWMKNGFQRETGKRRLTFEFEFQRIPGDDEASDTISRMRNGMEGADAVSRFFHNNCLMLFDDV